MRYFVGILYLMVFCSSSAQDGDTIYLDAVEVAYDFEKYAQGMVISTPDSGVFSQYQGESLGALLQATSGVYLRQYGGEGQISTVSFRGTTPSHTRVSWNGIDINSQTLGQTDFASVPVFHFSDVAVYHGASSVLFGSGAVGSTISLQNQLLRSKGLYVSAAQHFGSFEKQFSGLKVSGGNDKLNFYITGSHSSIANDFDVSFRNQTYEQNNAASRLWAVTGGWKYRFSSKKALLFESWYNVHDRELQPIMGNLTATDQLLEKNLRTRIAYHQTTQAGLLQASLAYVRDRQRYNEASYTNLDRYRVAGEYEFSAFANIDITGGLDLTLSIPHVSSYQPDTSQLRGGVFLLSRWRPLRKLAVSSNIRQPYLRGIKAPVVPSLGAELTVVEKETYNLAITAQTARSFRFPTLNDLFYQPGGNPLLQPEDGWTQEVGFKYRFSRDELEVHVHPAAYHSIIQGMIIWKPRPDTSYWYPENERKVEIFGIENSVKLRGPISEGNWQVGVSYTYNQSRNRSAIDNKDRSRGKQLAYVPLHKGTGMLGVMLRGWSFVYSESFTGMRYTEMTNTASLDAFSVAKFVIGKSLRFKKHQINLSIEADNLWDADYQNYEMRATPGRHYLIKLNYQLTKQNVQKQ